MYGIAAIVLLGNRGMVGERERESCPTPVHSCQRGMVAWAATVQPAQGLSPLFFIMVVGHERGVSCVRFLGI
jgi:hypothetical protein